MVVRVFKERFIKLFNIQNQTEEEIRVILHIRDFDDLNNGLLVDFYYADRKLALIKHDNKDALFDEKTSALFLKPLIFV